MSALPGTTRRRRGKTISLSQWIDVEVDLAEIETDDLVEELEARSVTHHATKTDVEQQTITDRYFQERRHAITLNPGSVTQQEREFWWHVHGKDL